jgi:hypothetical protein
MPQWGAGLLALYIVLGLSRTTWRKAGRLAFVVTGIVIALVMVSYMHSTPKPIFTTLPNGQIAQAPPQPGVAQKPSAEDTTGRELYVTPAAIAAAQSASQQQSYSSSSSSSSSSSTGGGADGP